MHGDGDGDDDDEELLEWSFGPISCFFLQICDCEVQMLEVLIF